MNNSAKTIEEVANCLNNGGVVLVPTDTVYGLAASPMHPEAVQKIFDLKSRPTRQNLPIMVADVKDLEKLGVDVNETSSKLLASHLMPGALSLVLGFKNIPQVDWLKGREEIAFRIPNNQALLEILRKTGPLLVTSANKHGSPQTPITTSGVLAELNGEPDMVLEGGNIENIPSAIVNCRQFPPVIERHGRIPYQEILTIIQS